MDESSKLDIKSLGIRPESDGIAKAEPSQQDRDQNDQILKHNIVSVLLERLSQFKK